MGISEIELQNTNPFSGLNLISLRKYACPESSKKKNEWYLACVDCDQKTTCCAGKRVMDILEDQTAPTEKLSFDKRFFEALKHKDPVDWLVQNHYYVDHHVAYNNFCTWKSRHPEVDIPKGLIWGGKRDKSKGAIIDRNKKASEKAVISRIEDTRSLIVELFDNCPEERRMFRYLNLGIKSDRKYHSAICKLESWIRKFPDLAKKYELSKVVKELRALGFNNERTLVEEVLNVIEPKLDRDVDGDEITLADFLKEARAKREEAKEKLEEIEAEPIPPKAVEVMTKPENAQVGTESNKLTEQIMLRDIFSEKRREITARIDREKANLRDLQAEIERLEGQVRALDETATLFGMIRRIDVGDKKEVVGA